MHLKFKKIINSNYFVLTLIWLGAIVVVNPFHEFPLNDDFLYVMSVMELTGPGRFVIDSWIAVTLVIHILWGSLFVSVFGFSFSVLRISTLVMSLAGILVSYKILAEVLKQRSLAFILALFIAFNPVYFNLSYTYMTDLTFYSMVVLSVLFYILSFEKKPKYYLYLATLFSILATLTRQVGLFVPLSALVTVIIIERKFLSRKVMKYFLHGLFILAVLITYLYWLKLTGREGEGFRNLDDVLESRNFVMIILQRVVDHSGRWLAETGLWFLPLALFFTVRTWSMFKRYLLPAGIITVLLGVAIILQTSQFPGGNIFYVLGLGPRTLSDAYILGQRESGALLEFMMVVLRALAIAGGLSITWLMVANIFEVFNRIWKKPDVMTRAKLFSFISVLVYQGVFLGSFTYFDRYAILLFVPVLILILPPAEYPHKLSRNTGGLALAFLVVLIFFSIAATRDYMNWNQVRWDAASELVKKDVAPKTIDGGLEYNAWQGTRFEKYGWWETENFDYVLTFKPIEGYKVMGKEPYLRLVPYSKEYIYILRKQ